MTRLPIAELTARLEKIASTPVSVLELASGAELNELCKGVVSGFSRLNKQQKIAALLEASKEIREAADAARKAEQHRLELEQLEQTRKAQDAVLEAYEAKLRAEAQLLRPVSDADLVAMDRYGESTPDFLNPVNVGLDLYQRVKAEVIRLTDDRKTEMIPEMIGTVASTLAAREARLYPVVSTRKRRRTEYLASLEAALATDPAPAYPDVVKRCVDSLRRQLEASFKDEVIALDQEYKSRLLQQKATRVEVDPLPHLERAYAILKDPSGKKWDALAYALAVATGRRMAEVTCTGDFTVLDSNRVLFKGQLKAGEERAKVGYDIPTLLPADLVVSGLEALKATGKRLEYTDDHRLCTKLADKRFSSGIQRYMSPLGMTFKDVRAIYAAVCAAVFKPEWTAENEYFRQILGHGEQSTATADSYLKFYVPSEKLPALKNFIESV
jgi:hypothetical protein